MAKLEWVKETPDSYYGRLTNRQWRIIISALSETGDTEAEELARDLIRFVLPANF